MKIYVNTANQPPTLSASLNAKTDATGVLKVYNSSFGSSVSQLKFKRGTTVPLEVVFADSAAAADVARLRVGVKLAGKFDDLLVVADETDAKTLNADGTVSFALKLTFDATAIDAALNVNASAADDLASAAFAVEFEWENAAGERTATETVPATIANNVCRGTTSASGATAGEWTALMVIRMSWEEFSALTERNPDAIYVVPDAPDPVEEHDASPDAHAELIQKIYDKVAEMLNAAFAGESGTAGTETAGTVRLSTAETLEADAGAIGADGNGRVRAAKASATAAGTVKLSTGTAMGVNDAAVGADSGGALRVASATAEVKGAVYLPASEASGLTSAAASLKLLGKKANALSVECGATSSSENCNQYSFVGPLSSLGVTGASADLNSVTFYRRANNTPNGATQVYLRLLKKVVGADGAAAWQIASQSVNAVAFSAQNANGGKCGTFYMKRVAGVEPPTCAETVALVMVGAADAEVNTSLQFGCKVAPSTTGGVCVSIPIAGAITMDKGGLASVPLVDVTWTPCAPAVGSASYDAPGVVQLSLTSTQIDDPLGIGKQADGRIVADMAQVRAVVNVAVAGVAAALEARVAELEAARTDIEARVAALEIS